MTIKELQIKQQELDIFIIRKCNIHMSVEEMTKNMILACHDEISEVEESPDDASEYIDVLHFVLSIANKYKLKLDNERDDGYNVLDLDLRKCLLKWTRESRIFKHWSTKQGYSAQVYLDYMVDIIHDNCIRLGVDMFEEYEKKYQINIERQNGGMY